MTWPYVGLPFHPGHNPLIHQYRECDGRALMIHDDVVVKGSLFVCYVPAARWWWNYDMHHPFEVSSMELALRVLDDLDERLRRGQVINWNVMIRSMAQCSLQASAPRELTDSLESAMMWE